MVIIQSFWAANQKIKANNFGWHSPRFHAISWTLSCLQLSKYYDVELYTDKIGYDFLIKKLNLPYKKTTIILDELNHYHKDLWALSKIKTYSCQERPFLHVDGDVFIWQPFSEELLNAGLVSQNLEVTTEYYKEMWKSIIPFLGFIPDEMKRYASGISQYACNMGIFGGNDINFIQKYCEVSLSFCKKNKNITKKITASNFNIFFEQVLFYEMMQKEGKEIHFLIEETSLDNAYEGFGDFHLVPFKKKYLHLLGVYKRSYHVCKLLEIYLLTHYPGYFKKIANLFPLEYKNLTNIIDYDFTLEKNKEYIVEFQKNLNNNFYSKNYYKHILQRDLYCFSKHNDLYNNLKNETDFSLLLIPNFNLFESNDIDLNKYIKIEELNNDEQDPIPVDEIDLIIFENIQEKILFSKLVEIMLAMLEEDAVDMQVQFTQMINDRIVFYLKNKIIAIL